MSKVEALAPRKERVADRAEESALAGFGRGLVPGRNARSLDCGARDDSGSVLRLLFSTPRKRT